MLIEETPIAKVRLPVEPFRAHMRLGSGFGLDDVQDAVITAFLRAAIAAAEARTGQCLLTRDFKLTITSWQTSVCHRLPVMPVTAVTQIDLVAANGTQTTVDPSTYWLEPHEERARLRATNGNLPVIEQAGKAIVTFTAGVTESWDNLPADLQQAVLMLAAHYYEYRNDTGLSEGCMPFGASSLLERHRIMRLGRGSDQ